MGSLVEDDVSTTTANTKTEYATVAETAIKKEEESVETPKTELIKTTEQIPLDSTWKTDGNFVFSPTTARNEPSSTIDNYLEKRRKERRKNRRNKNRKYEQKILEEEIRKIKGRNGKEKRKDRRRNKNKFPRPKTTTLPTIPLKTTMRPIVFPAFNPKSTTPKPMKPSLFVEEDSVPFTEANWMPMPPANEETNLDSLLSLLPTPSMPEGTIRWSDRTPFDMVYFTITIVEGPMSRKEPPKKRAIGARVYLMGLNMPSGYTQITEVLWQSRIK